MCGILVGASFDAVRNGNDFEGKWESLKVRNGQRGPDQSSCLSLQMSQGLTIQLFASELQLRGAGTVSQPHVASKSGNVLCWNGEVFEGLDVDNSENDGENLMDRIEASTNLANDLPNILSSLEGPYALVYFDNTSKTLYFGRDPLGRRSLLIHPASQEEPYLLIASVSCGLEGGIAFDEIVAEGIYRVRLGEWTHSGDLPAIEVAHRYDRAYQILNKTLSACPSAIDPESLPEEISQCVDAFISGLRRSVEVRASNIPPSRSGEARLAVLFSGGVDCTLLAFLADRFIPLEEPVDLLNVAFENPRKQHNAFLSSERGTGNKKKDRPPRQEFSVDGMVSYDVPDRKTGLEELAELRRLCPRRTWNFVEVDVPYKESSSSRTLIDDLMYPQRTVMDMSLGLALYFASRGVGHVRNADGVAQPYTSTARVLLSGLGSDELAGGYSRHRTAFENGGWVALNDELQLELDRIPSRNLGRDDRVVSSHGKELRLPFLSLAVVKQCASLPVHFKIDPRLPVGVGDKLLVREAARRLGLNLASRRKKRAMQFGSRSARMEIGSESERKGDMLLPTREE